MKFQKYAKAYHLVIEGAAGLRDMLAIDDSFWAATSAPTTAFREDAAFLSFLDSDHNGRIRSDEVRAAAKWLLGMLADTDGIGAESDEMPLSAVSKDAPGGAGILTTMGYVNEQAKRTDGIVRLADVRAEMAELRGKPLNGDGILIEDAAQGDAALAEYIQAAVSATGGSADISGKTGVSSDQLAAFQAAIGDFLAWKALGKDDNAETMPLGADTSAVYNLYLRHKDEVDRFFFLSGFQRFDAAAAEKFIAADAASDSPAKALGGAPIARPLPDGSLPLTGDGVNPLRRDIVEALRDGLFGRVLGTKAPERATEEEWNRVKATLEKHAAYLAGKKGAIVEAFPMEKLEAWADGALAKKAEELQRLDKEVADRCAAFADVEKLLLFRRRLPCFANNFVALTQFYDPNDTSLFECGRLLIDGRWFNLAIKIADPGAHSAVAKNGGLFTMYLNVEPVGTAPAFTVVVPATAGTRGNIAVGKRGVFFNLAGEEFDATVTSIIENPISLKEAMLAPFKNITKMILGKIESLSSNAQASIEKGAETATNDAMAGKKPEAPAAAPAGGMGAGGLLMGASVAIAALGSTFAFLAKSISSMSVSARITTVIIAVLVVVGPILLAGFIKLMGQDMGPILEGCGWAVNKSMRLTRKLRNQFTETKAYPKDATGTPVRRLRAVLLFFLLLAAIAALVSVLMRPKAEEPCCREPAPATVSVAAEAPAAAESVPEAPAAAEPAPEAPAVEEPAPAAE